MALYCDLVPEKLQPAAAARLLHHLDRFDGRLSTGIITTAKLPLVLSRFGSTDRAYSLMESRRFPSLGFMIDQGSTTIWERWDNYLPETGLDHSGMTSFNHYAFGGMAEWLYRVVLGINRDNDRVAYRHFVLRPEPGGSVTWAHGHYDSIRGRIASDWKIADGKFVWNCTIPVNTTATVYIPTSDPTSVKEGGRAAVAAPGVKFVRREPGATVCELQSGRYEFTAALGLPKAGTVTDGATSNDGSKSGTIKVGDSTGG
jgi:alpha-L-rhamnosidase